MNHSGMGGMGGMDGGMGGASCKISMLWNWYTIDACRYRSNHLALLPKSNSPSPFFCQASSPRHGT
jgi:hypothetical protein